MAKDDYEKTEFLNGKIQISGRAVKRFSEYLLDTYNHWRRYKPGIEIFFFVAKIMQGVSYKEFFKSVSQRQAEIPMAKDLPYPSAERKMSLKDAENFLKAIDTAKCNDYYLADENEEVFFNDEDKKKAIHACVKWIEENMNYAISKVDSEIKEFYDKTKNEFEKPAAQVTESKDTDKMRELTKKLLAKYHSTVYRQVDGRFTVRSEFFSGEFQREQNLFSEYAERKTGFKTLDEVQIFAPGLYVLGGLPSVGKTTLSWQMADYLASAGEGVIYISYEMSPMELYSKTISREVYLDTNGRVQCPAVNIRRKLYGDNQEVQDKIYTFATSFGGGAAIFKVGSESAAEILTLMRKHCEKIQEDNAARKLNTKQPIFFIDYLQLVAVGSREVKNSIDEFVRHLKIFQQETNATVICLSSFNRDNYLNTVGFESFKESGGIEYTADVVVGLQYDCIKHFAPSDTLTDRRDKLQNARQMSPREINLVCLKNRFGSVYDLEFKYYPAVDLFVCADDKPIVNGLPKRPAR